ncbi:hypothetical protein RJ40_12000 [Methanofollis aquaemaris]|uniref:Uncharacterized protein n=1 Tax=Methanofollis aquaemaris TaxID=126734 RepID=A0A8A3S8B1_9EURY|nr:hypothetical protein [Methanofollis aquaemaris]QSZ68163.1 hypothetical protein RJ40_12000 [Methanofollis aquaemaris]
MKEGSDDYNEGVAVSDPISHVKYRGAARYWRKTAERGMMRRENFLRLWRCSRRSSPHRENPTIRKHRYYHTGFKKIEDRNPKLPGPECKEDSIVE